MPNYIVQGSDLSSVATAIRTKGSTSDQLAFPTGFVSAIEALPSGGGGISGVTVLEDVTLTEAVRSVQFDIPSGYNSAYILIHGEFASSDWLYWKISSSNENYQAQNTIVDASFFVVRDASNAYLAGFRHTGGAPNALSSNNLTATVYFRGYSADFKVGTRFLILGGKYADI